MFAQLSPFESWAAIVTLGGAAAYVLIPVVRSFLRFDVDEPIGPSWLDELDVVESTAVPEGHAYLFSTAEFRDAALRTFDVPSFVVLAPRPFDWSVDAPELAA